MAELFKDIYNRKFFNGLASVIEQAVPRFPKKAFLKFIFDKAWEERELKERMRHASIALKTHLSEDYKKNVKTILKVIQLLQKNGVKESSLEYMIFPDFIEVYGLNDFEISMRAIEKTTAFTSCEFAIRPFIIKYEKASMQQMLAWSKHKNKHVRRLSSEGCRPRLPWAMAIPNFKKSPKLVLPILKNLSDDPSEYVRRSVANNLNDISKDNPDVVLTLAKKWKGQSAEKDWLVKHACRTLLKQGGTEVMALFGFGDVKKIAVNNFRINTPKVNVGAFVSFDFELENKNSAATKIRLEYGLYYQKANGTLSKKVFKISEKEYAAKSKTPINRKQSFKLITTRRFHLGLHQVSIIINGREFETYDFELIA